MRVTQFTKRIVISYYDYWNIKDRYSLNIAFFVINCYIFFGGLLKYRNLTITWLDNSIVSLANEVSQWSPFITRVHFRRTLFSSTATSSSRRGRPSPNPLPPWQISTTVRSLIYPPVAQDPIGAGI